MPLKSQLDELPSPLRIGADIVVLTVLELVNVLLDDSQASLEKLPNQDDDERSEFLLACDALNVWRLKYRLREEYGDSLSHLVSDDVIANICDIREYESEEFSLALEATSSRARFPFGLDPLRFAALRATTDPIVVLHPEVQEPLVQKIFATAIHLQNVNGFKPILLPIEQLRQIFHCRKLLAGGAIKKLLKFDLITDLGLKAHTGRAREFRVLAKEGVDYKFKEKGTRNEPTPHL